MATIGGDLSGGGEDGPCFVCGSTDVASKAQPRRRYAELTTLFKALVMTTDLQKKLGGSVYANFTTNVESCATCLATIKDVGDLRQEIVTLQTQLDGLLDGTRSKLGQIKQKSEQKGSARISEGNPSRKRKKLPVELVQIKEEDLHGFEIVPDFGDPMEMEASLIEGHEMVGEDPDFGNNTPCESEDDTPDDHHDTDYVPASSLATKSFTRSTKLRVRRDLKLNPDSSNRTLQSSETLLTLDDDDASSSSDDSENVVVAKKSRNIVDWENVTDFGSLEDAKKFITDRKDCVYKSQYVTKDSQIDVYLCKHSRSCSSKWRVTHPLESDVFHVEKTISEHDHVPKKGRGLSEELRQEIMNLVENGTKKPSAIISILRRREIEPPTKSQLTNFLAYRKNVKGLII